MRCYKKNNENKHNDKLHLTAQTLNVRKMIWQFVVVPSTRIFQGKAV